MQWNLQAYRTKFYDLKQLLNKYHPACMSLQETMIRNRQVKPPSQYIIYNSNVVRNDGHERGASILVHRTVHHEVIPLNTTLQATAIRLVLNKKYTLCSLYLPHHNINADEIEDLLQQLPRPFVLQGDLNARSGLWRDTVENPRGKMIEEIIRNNDVIVMNDGRATHYHSQTNTYSIVDLAICSADCGLDFEYDVLESLYLSDHYSAILEPVSFSNNISYVPSFNVDRADWNSFKE